MINLDGGRVTLLLGENFCGKLCKFAVGFESPGRYQRGKSAFEQAKLRRLSETVDKLFDKRIGIRTRHNFNFNNIIVHAHHAKIRRSENLRGVDRRHEVNAAVHQRDKIREAFVIFGVQNFVGTLDNLRIDFNIGLGRAVNRLEASFGL